VESRASSRGGNPRATRAQRPGAMPETRPTIEGPGDALENMLARATARRSDVPVVLPDQLVIDKLVRPVYPEEAREKNIEGKVSVLALVDTTGAVVEVDVVGDSAHHLLEQAAVSAVWQCRFRPYRIAGKPREVYVVIPFNFTIY
jgi:TonB family protein